MAVTPKDDDEYEGPTLEDLKDLYADDELENAPAPARSNTIIPRTIQETLQAADTQHLEPWLSDNGNWVGFNCPICQTLGRKAAATVEKTKLGVLQVTCAGCHDDIHPGILATLGAINPNGNVIPLHPEHANGTQPDPSLLSWVPLDLVTLGDTPRIPPAISGLLYPGRRHILTGESEAGKSWLAFAITADEIKQDRGVVWVDLDYMGAQDILERLRQFGCTDEQIRERFAFYQPDGQLEGYSLDAVTQLIRDKNARLVIIDAFTGFCALHNLKPNDGIDIEKAYRLMQPLCDTGCAVAIIDHVIKDAATRGRYAAGSERKLSGADVAIGFTLIEPYARGHTGRSRLTIHKDRPAQLNRPTAGIFTLTSHPDTHQVTWELEEDHTKGTDGVIRLTGYMERVSTYVETQLPSHATGSQIENDVTGNAKHIRSAIKTLVAEGYLHLETAGRAHHYTSLRPYREDEE